MIRLQIGDYHFSPKLIPTLATIILVPFLASLGLWQLDRADQKREIDNGVKQAQAKKALDLNDVINSNSHYDFSKEIFRSALITGRYDSEHQYLLDNRTYKGKAGFHVLTPFILDSSRLDSGRLDRSRLDSISKTILINRGWISYQGTRDNIPDISVTESAIKIRGVMKQQGRAIVLNKRNNDSNELKPTYPKLVQSVQLTELAKELNVKLLPIIIELDKNDKTGFIRDWQPYYGSIDKHNAYALQWFSFSVILLFLFIKLNTKKVKK